MLRPVSLNHCFLTRAFVFLMLMGISAANIKYTHGSLMPPLSVRSLSSRSSDDLQINGAGGGTSNAPALTGPTENGGEVLASKSFPISAQEPTCEQLRAMWIFSKRQSRAAEITNEIPTYRDPFAYNVWEPYYSTTRSLGSVRVVPRYGERSSSPVFGRLVNREPVFPPRPTLNHRQRHIGADVVPNLVYGAESKPSASQAVGSRRPSQSRLVGGNGQSTLNAINSANPNSQAIQGSFQKLKQLIWTERAKELTQQRKAEEMAARAAVLKEIANGQNIQSSSYRHSFKSESPLMDENRSPDRDRETSDHLKDERLSIAKEQLRSGAINNNRKSKSLTTANTRAYGSGVGSRGGHGTNKSPPSGTIFSGNIAADSSNSGRSARLRLPSVMAEDEKNYSRNVGTPRAYPAYSSHFRERNRSLNKQTYPIEYYKRNARNYPLTASNIDLLVKNMALYKSNEDFSDQHQGQVDDFKDSIDSLIDDRNTNNIENNYEMSLDSKAAINNYVDDDEAELSDSSPNYFDELMFNIEQYY